MLVGKNFPTHRRPGRHGVLRALLLACLVVLLSLLLARQLDARDRDRATASATIVAPVRVGPAQPPSAEARDVQRRERPCRQADAQDSRPPVPQCRQQLIELY